MSFREIRTAKMFRPVNSHIKMPVCVPESAFAICLRSVCVVFAIDPFAMCVRTLGGQLLRNSRVQG